MSEEKCNSQTITISDISGTQAKKLSNAVRVLGHTVMLSMGGCLEMEETLNGHKVAALSRFPTARLNVEIKSGKWYYECHLITADCMQIGWANQGFVPKEHEGAGLGDDAHSWAYDGLRQKKWNGANSVTYGEGAKWKAGDVVGCCIDIDTGSIRFLLNGKDLGAAYSGLKFRDNNIYPAGSFQGQITHNTRQCAVFVFDDIHFRHEIPRGYHAINSSKYFKEIKYREILADANRMCFCFMALRKYRDKVQESQGYSCKSCFRQIEGTMYYCRRRRGCPFKNNTTNTYVMCSDCHDTSDVGNSENESETNRNDFVCKKVDISLSKIS